MRAVLLSLLPLVFFFLPAILLEGGVVGENLRIINVESFTEFSSSVNSGINYIGTTVFLDTDLDFSEKTLTPVGWYNSNGTFKDFKGTFDGQGHVISNLNVSVNSVGVGLFGFSNGGITIKSIVIDESCSFENTYNNNYNLSVGGILGWCYTNDNQCTIENSVNMASVSFNGNTESYIEDWRDCWCYFRSKLRNHH